MKKKVYLVSFLLLLLASFATVTIYNKTKEHSQNSEETKHKNQVIDKEKMKIAQKKNNERTRDSFSVDLKNADAEKIFKIFNGPNADEIINLLEMNNDSDRVLVASDGTISKGKMFVGENQVEIDSDTDKNGITIKELKELIQLHKEKIDELAIQNAPKE
ncbi:hypothetical protein ACWOC1_06040 [Enterococcus quebecensis]|uniref:DUF1310 domain-containing protein n=1 Tax=Enterococcus quebecensis TaxID=903983 RepID=A0A1E5GV21_9ENTE|nr:hypothetical protein [Enterococcus quebecensis]OEG16521.1 hypothetical protein BCR23_06430 [Enterococcus quebecensis]OJG74105.1 hypothetical protein RV12_GL002743 [Enterococcus quebecensis]